MHLIKSLPPAFMQSKEQLLIQPSTKFRYHDTRIAPHRKIKENSPLSCGPSHKQSASENKLSKDFRVGGIRGPSIFSPRRQAIKAILSLSPRGRKLTPGERVPSWAHLRKVALNPEMRITSSPRGTQEMSSRPIIPRLFISQRKGEGNIHMHMPMHIHMHRHTNSQVINSSMKSRKAEKNKRLSPNVGTKRRWEREQIGEGINLEIGQSDIEGETTSHPISNLQHLGSPKYVHIRRTIISKTAGGNSSSMPALHKGGRNKKCINNITGSTSTVSFKIDPSLNNSKKYIYKNNYSKSESNQKESLITEMLDIFNPKQTRNGSLESTRFSTSHLGFSDSMDLIKKVQNGENEGSPRPSFNKESYAYKHHPPIKRKPCFTLNHSTPTKSPKIFSNLLKPQSPVKSIKISIPSPDCPYGREEISLCSERKHRRNSGEVVPSANNKLLNVRSKKMKKELGIGDLMGCKIVGKKSIIATTFFLDERKKEISGGTALDVVHESPAHKKIIFDDI